MIVFGCGRFILIFLFVSFKYVRYMCRYSCYNSFSIGISFRSFYWVIEKGFIGVKEESVVIELDIEVKK